MNHKKDLFRFNSNNRQKKIIRASIVFIICLFMGIIIYSIVNLIVNHDKTATIEVLVAPSDSTLKIDGRIFPTDTTIKIKPGTYAVKIEKDGFTAYNGSITANNNETSYIFEYLNETDENGTYYKDNEKEAARAQQISDKIADIFHTNYTGTDEIWNVTPYDDYPSGYKIYAEKDSSGNILLNIYLYTCDNTKVEKLKSKAIEYLEEKKIDTSKYTIKYSSCN